MRNSILVVGDGPVALDLTAWLSHNGSDFTTWTPAGPEQIIDYHWIIIANDGAIEDTQRLIKLVVEQRKAGAVVAIDSSLHRLSTLIGFDRNISDIGVMHLFVPMQSMPLAEIVAFDQKSREALEFLGRHLLGRYVVSCVDCTGFVANRVALTLAAKSIVISSVLGLSPAICDASYTRATGSKIGPYKLWDIIGRRSFFETISGLSSAISGDQDLNQRLIEALANVDAQLPSDLNFYCKLPSGERQCYNLLLKTYRSALEEPDRVLAKTIGKLRMAITERVAAEQSALFAAVDEIVSLGYGWNRLPQP